MTTTYGPVTYAEIRDRIARHLDKCRAQAIKEAWQRLDEVAAELQSAEGSSLAQLGPWRLLSLTVSGFRGIGNPEDDPLLLDFTPTPGITVLCGQNGSGKTSLTDALQTAFLTKKPTTVTAGVNAQLWQPVPLAQGAQRAKIEALLQSAQGNARHELLITVHVAEQTAPQIVLTSRVGEQATTRECTTAELADLLGGHSPIVAYADIERSLTTQRDLNSRLMSLLQLGSRIARLEDEVARRSIPAKEAEAELKKQWQATEALLQEVKEELAQLDPDQAPPIPEAPTSSDDLSTWHPELPLHPAVTPAWEAQWVRTAQAAAVSFSKTRQQVHQAADLAQSRVAHILSELLQEQAALSDDCPVCGTATDWRETARESLERLREAQTAWQFLQQQTREFVDALRPLAATEAHHDVAQADVQQLLQLSGQAVDSLKLGDVTDELLLQCDIAASLLASLDISDYLTQAPDTHVTQARLVQRWNNAVATYREHHLKLAPLTQEASTWNKTKTHYSTIASELRKERSYFLTSHTAQWVNNLLQDSGITLNNIEVGAKTGQILLMAQDKDLTLGMLSAGQRNALLLATMVATYDTRQDASPFGFLILDDPVHAFDDMRIGPLAKAIAKIAATSRVIVLTHDERLREHLCALECQDVPTEVHRITRTNGRVQVEQETDISLSLVNDAINIILAADKFHAPNVMDGYTSTVRALLRQALDTALTSHALRLDALHPSTTLLLAELESKSDAFTTRQRLNKIKKRWTSLKLAMPQELAAKDLGQLLDKLSSGAHHERGGIPGERPNKDDLLEECERVKRVCQAALAPVPPSGEPWR